MNYERQRLGQRSETALPCFLRVYSFRFVCSPLHRSLLEVQSAVIGQCWITEDDREVTDVGLPTSGPRETLF